MIDPAEDAPSHLVAFLAEHAIEAVFLSPGVAMPTVATAAEAIGVPEEQILKTLLFVGNEGDYVVAIASGVRRVDRNLLAQASGVAKPRAAKPEAVMDIVGYPAGGVAPLALPANVPVIVDTAVLTLPVAFGGGGREHLLLRVLPADIVRFNNAAVASIVQTG
jgi:prolyl-tRNA editing enzyme YbaK/EbsC (Cys-tRNA(Pro) deacylase)